MATNFTPNILDQAQNSVLLAQRILDLTRRITPYVMTGQTEWDPTQFQQGDTITLHGAADRGEAESVDPYSLTPATVRNPEDVTVQLALENIFTDQFRVFSTDANVDRYINTNASASANAVGKAVENYFYEKCFTDFTNIPGTGTYSFNADPTLSVVWREDGSGNLLPMTRNLLYDAQASLDTRNVSVDGRWAITSPYGVTDYFSDAPTDEGDVGTQARGAEILQAGLPMGMFIDRGGFMFGKSNAVRSQPALADIEGGNPTTAITAVADDTTLFFDGTFHSAFATLIGAVELTTAALTSGAEELAVGDTVRIGPTGGTATAYGRVIRISPARTEVYVVPYDAQGRKLTAAEINTGTDLLSAPLIGKLGTAHQTQYLSYAFRALRPPSDFSGARMVQVRDPFTNIMLMLIMGNYQVNLFSETMSSTALCGTKPTNHNKATMLLSA